MGLRRMRPDGTVVSQWPLPLLSDAKQVGLDGSDNLYVLLGPCGSQCPAPTTTFGTGSRGVLFGKVDATGSFVWLDRLTDVYGGAPGEWLPPVMQVDTAGNVYLTGTADCAFSTTPGSFQPQCAPSDTVASFAAKVDSTGANLLYATFLRGTTQNSLAIDESGSA